MSVYPMAVLTIPTPPTLSLLTSIASLFALLPKSLQSLCGQHRSLHHSAFAWGAAEGVWELQTHHLPPECIHCSSVTIPCAIGHMKLFLLQGERGTELSWIKACTQVVAAEGLPDGMQDWAVVHDHSSDRFLLCMNKCWSFVSLMGTMQSLCGFCFCFCFWHPMLLFCFEASDCFQELAREKYK